MGKTLKSVVKYAGHQFSDPIKTSINPFKQENWRRLAANATNSDPGDVVRINAGDGAADTLNGVVDAVAPAALQLLNFIPGLGVAAAGAYKAADAYGSGASIGKSLAQGAIGAGTAYAGNALGGAVSGNGFGGGLTSTGPFGAASSSYGAGAGGAYDTVTNSSIDSIGSGLGSSTSTLGSTAGNAAGNIGGYTPSVASSTLSTGGNVAANSTGSLISGLSKFSPLVSAGLGTYTNLQAKNDLLDAEKKNIKLLQPFATQSFEPGDLEQDPGYQFQLAQGNKALDRQQAAKGNYFSGQALQDAQNFGQGLAGTTYNDAFNRFLANQGQRLSAVGALTGVNNDIGNTKASSITNLGNLLSSTGGALLGGSSYGNQGQALGQGTDIQSLLRLFGG